METEIWIPHWHPAPLNKLLQSRWNAAKLKKQDRGVIAHYFRGCPLATTKRAVSLTIVLRKGRRGCDVDAYHKSLLDALVKAGMLVNDNHQWCSINPIKTERGTESKWGSIVSLIDMP